MSRPRPGPEPAGGPLDAPTAAVLLLAECLDAARAAARHEPRSADRLRVAGERLDRALASLPHVAGDVRDRAADLLVGLSAAGVAPAERDAMVAQLLGVLAEVSPALGAGTPPAPGPAPPRASPSGTPPGSWQRGTAAPH